LSVFKVNKRHPLDAFFIREVLKNRMLDLCCPLKVVQVGAGKKGNGILESKNMFFDATVT